MGRHVEFDADSAKKAAIELFWSKGYHAATLDLLCEIMGISRSSFYTTFGDKRTFFIECMNMYLNQMNQAFSIISSFEELKQWTINWFCDKKSDRTNMGCMVVSIAAEMADVDDELVKLMRDGMQTVTQARIQIFLRMGCNQSLAKRLGSFFQVFAEGLLVGSRREIPRQKIKEIIETGFDLMLSTIEGSEQSFA